MQSSINLCSHPLIHAFIHQFMHPSINACIHPSIHAFIHQFMHPSINSCIHLSIHAFIHQFMHWSINSCIHPSIHAFIHQFMHPPIDSKFFSYQNIAEILACISWLSFQGPQCIEKTASQEQILVAHPHRPSKLAVEVNFNSIPRNMELKATATPPWLVSRVFTDSGSLGLAFSKTTRPWLCGLLMLIDSGSCHVSAINITSIL